MNQSKQKKNSEKSDQPETITAEEALKRMKNFGERKEKIIASINKSKN